MRICAIFLVLFLVTAVTLSAQTGTGTLRGRVTDPSGAVIAGATVSATAKDGKSATTVSNDHGVYEFKGLAPSDYTITTSAKGFAVDQEGAVQVTAGQVLQFDIGLQIAVEEQHVEVQENAPMVDVAPESNASTLVLKGKDLDVLSDDPDELQDELQALAGPSAGPNGGQIYVDGFTAGQLPPKSAIREIRINQNPFSAQYDKLGYGRIEIFTKPGSDHLHGQVMVNGNASAFNSLNPFVSNVEPYNTELYNGSIGGSLSKKTSFTFDVQQRDIGFPSVVVAQVLDPSLNIIAFNESIPSPQTRLNLTPRMDFQLTPNNTLTVRYQYERQDQTNEGVGGFDLPSVGYNQLTTEQTVQISDTQVISQSIVNETRFQYIRDNSNQDPVSTDVNLNVQGAFIGGGSSQGTQVDHQDHCELQNYTSMAKGSHFIKFGGRLRGTQESSITTSNFNGTYTFQSLNAYQITEMGIQQGLTPAEIRALGGGASQFSITAGQPLSDVSMMDVGLYAEDEWRIRPNISVNYGLRYETQSAIPYHGDWAPRVSVAWGLARGKNPAKTVVRAGYGIFYDRFSYDYVLQAERLNGTTQQQYIVADPNFYPEIPPIPLLQQLAKASPTTYQVASNLQPPSIYQAAVSIERQIGKSATVSLTYLNSRGEHQLFLRNANAPLPGTYNPADPTSGIRPFGGNGNIYQYNSEGIFRQNQLIANFRMNVGRKISLFGYYSLNFANSDLGAGSGSFGGAFFGGGGGMPQFIMNSYDPMEDYGRASFDVRNRVFVGGTIYVPYGFRLNPFIMAASGVPFNITIGQDLNGDSIFNDRPSLVGPPGPGGVIVNTPFGTFNTVPLPGQPIVPINYGTGEPIFTLNLRLSRTFPFGPKTEGHSTSGMPGGHGGGGGRGGGLGPRGLSGGGGNPFNLGTESNRRYNMTFSINARNLLNNVNYAPPIGNLASPLFGQSNALAGGPFSSGAANRRIDLQMLFSF